MRLYAFGGEGLQSSESWQPGEAVWTSELGTIPVNRDGATGVVWRGAFYLIGGGVS